MIYANAEQSTKERIADAYIIRGYFDAASRAEDALGLPSAERDPFLQYVLGEWCYALGSLTWVQRKAAAAIFGSPPQVPWRRCLDP